MAKPMSTKTKLKAPVETLSESIVDKDIPDFEKRGVVIGLRYAMMQVAHFHDRLGIHPPESLVASPRCENFEATEKLEAVAATLSTLAEELMTLYLATEDTRLIRAHLDAEESSEFFSAMASRDEIAMLDALADKAYVTVGSAVSFDLPLPEAFVEVHCSNMTKQRQGDDPQGDRVRQKGPQYKAPQLPLILQRYRSLWASPHALISVMGGLDECKFCGMDTEQILRQKKKYGRLSCKGHGEVAKP